MVLELFSGKVPAFICAKFERRVEYQLYCRLIHSFVENLLAYTYTHYILHI